MSLFETKKLIPKMHFKVCLTILVFMCINSSNTYKGNIITWVLLSLIPLTLLFDLKSIFSLYSSRIQPLRKSNSPMEEEENNFTIRELEKEKKSRVYELITTFILAVIGTYCLIYTLNCVTIMEKGYSQSCTIKHIDPETNELKILLKEKDIPIDSTKSRSYNYLFTSGDYLNNKNYCGECSLLPLAVYLTSLCLYHFMEFYFVCKFHFDKLNWDSFLLNQSKEYVFTITFSLVEYLIEWYFDLKIEIPIVLYIGFLLLVIGQFFRISSEFTAGRNFTHQIALNKLAKHKLITEGVYKYIRHPSYFGFFWWSLGTQILCMNYISIIGFLFALVSFFRSRINYEELLLIKFFGKDYIEYKNKTPIWIPCKYQNNLYLVMGANTPEDEEHALSMHGYDKSPYSDRGEKCD